MISVRPADQDSPDDVALPHSATQDGAQGCCASSAALPFPVTEDAVDLSRQFGSHKTESQQTIARTDQDLLMYEFQSHIENVNMLMQQHRKRLLRMMCGMWMLFIVVIGIANKVASCK